MSIVVVGGTLVGYSGSKQQCGSQFLHNLHTHTNTQRNSGLSHPRHCRCPGGLEQTVQFFEMEVDDTGLLYRHDCRVDVHALDDSTLYHLSLRVTGRTLPVTRRNTGLVFFGLSTLFLRVYGIVDFVALGVVYHVFAHVLHILGQDGMSRLVRTQKRGRTAATAARIRTTSGPEKSTMIQRAFWALALSKSPFTSSRLITIMNASNASVKRMLLFYYERIVSMLLLLDYANNSMILCSSGALANILL